MGKLFFTAIAVLPLAQAVWAADLCQGGPRDQWLTEAQITERMAELGHVEFFLTIEDGCIEAIVTAHGVHLEYYLDPISGEVVKVEEE